jgi:hypothetical protein
LLSSKGLPSGRQIESRAERLGERLEGRFSNTGKLPENIDHGLKRMQMQEEEWIETLADGRSVKFIYQVLPLDGTFITAQIAGNKVVYSIVWTKAGNLLSREDVESHFRDELSKK